MVLTEIRSKLSTSTLLCLAAKHSPLFCTRHFKIYCRTISFVPIQLQLIRPRLHGFARKLSYW